tara:strand:- start:238 stop:519 length:282 start_codon:yes stop_codon:yes gene_type:complete
MKIIFKYIFRSLLKKMSETKNEKKSCRGKGKAMFTYGILQLGSSLISAISLALIAFSLCNLKSESKNFNNCVEEKIEQSTSISESVNYCNGGN